MSFPGFWTVLPYRLATKRHKKARKPFEPPRPPRIFAVDVETPEQEATERAEMSASNGIRFLCLLMLQLFLQAWLGVGLRKERIVNRWKLYWGGVGVVVFLLAGGVRATETENSLRVAIEGVLCAQAEAWNRGDIPGFMEHYWKSDDLTFSSGGKTTRGWQATLDNYRKRYPTPRAMGRVSFNELEITPLGEQAAFVLGRWQLDRESEPVGGNFTLVFQKIDDRWVIVHDHTSRLVESGS